MSFIIRDIINKSSIIKEGNSADSNHDINLVFDSTNKKEIVLCIGQVQSGKTNKILDCIDKSLFELSYDVVIVFGGTNNFLFEQTKKRLMDKFKNIESELYFVDKENFSYSGYIDSRKYIINIMKSSKNLQSAFSFLDKINLIDKKILIVDDESDYASIDIGHLSSSVIYEKIRSIYKRIYNGKMLQVTATPFANIVSSNTKDLEADRVICWSTNTEYTGLQEFNDHKNAYEIVMAEKDDIKTCKESVIKSLKYFLSILVLKFDKYKNISNGVCCLFNINLDTDKHEIISDYINMTIMNINSYPDKFYQDYIFQHMNKDDFYYKWEYICKNLNWEILNSKNKIQTKHFKYNIFIGGTFLSRGNTFENLITELIINVPNEEIYLDTLLQRCRWFGYRKHIIDDIKIFINQRTFDALQEASKYVDLLIPGEHDFSELKWKIKSLDINKNFVISTSRLKRR